MAKLSSSISLIDNMSKVLNRITGNTDKMKKSIDNTQKQMNQETNFAKNLSRDEQKLELLGAQFAHQARMVEKLRRQYEQTAQATGRYSDATDKLKTKLLSAQLTEIKLADAVDKAGKALEQQDNQLKKNTQSSGGLISKVKGLVGAYLGFRGAKALMKATIGQAGELSRQVGVMQAAFGDAEVGKNYFNKLQLYAIDTRQDIDALTDVTRNFMQITKNTKHLRGFTDAANKLSLRTNSIGSAENLMQEAMRGNFTRLQRTLHLTDAQIAPLKKAISKGSLEGIIKGFDDAMNTAGLTDAIVDALQNNPMEKLGKAMDRFKTGMAMAGEEALARLEPLFDKLNEWLQSSNADSFFGAIAMGITLVVESVSWLTNAIVDNWSIIQPILMAIGTVYLAYIITQIQITTGKIIEMAGAWLLAHWPVLLIVGAVALFIAVLIQSGVTVSQVTGFIGGAFGVLFAFLYNGVAIVWNNFAGLAEFFANAWNHPIYTVKSLFANMAHTVLDMAISISSGFDTVATNIANAFVKAANMAIGAINWIKEELNKIPGVDLSMSGKWQATSSITGTMVNAKNNVDKWLGDAPTGYWKAPRMDLKSIGGSMTSGYEFGASLPGKFSTGLDSIKNSIGDFAGQEDAWNNLQNNGLNNGLGGLGKQGKDLNKTGKDLKKSVDKSSEDLKYLRDLAEKDTINRFTTAEIKVENHNEMNINNEMDLDGVINYLAEGVDESMQIAAEGVY